MTWGRFERFALDGPDKGWIAALFWPQFLASMLYLILAPMRDLWWSASQRLKRPRRIAKA